MKISVISRQPDELIRYSQAYRSTRSYYENLSWIQYMRYVEHFVQHTT